MQRLRPCLLALVALLSPARSPAAQPSPANLAAFDRYRLSVGTRIEAAHRTSTFVIAAPELLARVHRGETVLEQLTPPQLLPGMEGALLHHWRGTALLPGARAQAFQQLLTNYPAYPGVFAPQVLRASARAFSPGHTLVALRVQQQHVLTVVMDQVYDVSGDAGASNGWSTSTSAHVAEIASPGTPSEHPLAPEDEHGFLYAQVTFWSWTEVPGGLLVQLETLSLTRDVPRPLRWAAKPYLATIPRETLSFTLRCAASALAR